MKLRKVTISGFKSFKEKTSINIDDLTTIIGANSSGKTSFFQALLRMFGENGQDRELRKSDFFFPNNGNLDEINERNMFIETEFEFDANSSDSSDEYSIPNFLNQFVINKAKDIPYIRIRLEAYWKKASQPDGIIEKEIFFVVSDKEEFEESDKSRITNEILSKIKFVYVPAVRNPHIQLKNVAGSILWRLLNGINLDDKFKNKVNDKIIKVNEIIQQHEGIDKIKDILEEQWSKYHTDKRYKNVEFIFNTSDINSILKKIEPSFTPTETGNPYNVDEIGDGLKSLFYFSLVGTLLGAENETIKEITKAEEVEEKIFNFEPPFITILGVEEPENHISPYILGKIIKNLKDISENNNAQVILSSHSPSIVRRIDPENIRYFKIDKATGSSEVKQIKLPKKEEAAFTYVKEAVQAYPELYFANMVILGEGDSEEVVIPKILEAYGIDVISNEIAIVPLGGRHVNHFWRLLEELDIPYVTLLDLDVERDGGGFGRIKYAIEQLIENGYDSDDLLYLDVEKEIMSKEDFKDMHTWDAFDDDGTMTILEAWADELEEYGIFYSWPIDLDFMMLQCFEDEYKSILDEEGSKGPKIVIDSKEVYIKDITEKQMESSEYKEKVKTEVHATLKSEKKDGENFTDEERALMVWYNYFFLYRGKPVMHRLALSKIDEDDLRENMPQVFESLCEEIENILEGDE